MGLKISRADVGLTALGFPAVVEALRNGALIGVVAGVALLGVKAGWNALHAAPEQAAIHPELIASLPSAAQRSARYADFGDDPPSPDARHIANWVADSGDNENYDFVIVDKKFAKVYVFDADARLRGSTPVLLGAAPGDDSVPGIGTRAIADIRVEERTTPAGRFAGQRGMNALHEDVVWVDYGAAVSMHRVRVTDPRERRLERLASPSVDDNRISWGCINIPAAFYEGFVQPVFAHRKAIVYVLPEVRDVQQVFGSYDVTIAHRTGAPADLPVASR